MLNRKYIKSRDVWKVTFGVDFMPDASQVELAGDFNNWQPSTMERNKSGVFALTLDLKPGRSYQYRYIIDGRWENDWAADRYEPNEFGADNSVIEC